MKKHEQIVYLAAAGITETFVTFRCDKCKAKFSAQTLSIYGAAGKAVSAGWRVKDLDGILCPECAGEQP